MDLSKGTFTSGYKHYCCRCIYHADNDDQRKISLSSGNIKVNGAKRAGYYKQSPTANTKLAAIRYYFDGIGPNPRNTNNPKKRRRIKIPELSFPTSDVEAVYAVHCSNNPVLIYVQPLGKWFKKPNNANDNGNEEWEKVLDEVPDPESITDCEEYNQLVKVLNDTGRCGLPLCPLPPNPASPGPEELTGSVDPAKGAQEAQRTVDHKSPDLKQLPISTYQSNATKGDGKGQGPGTIPPGGDGTATTTSSPPGTTTPKAAAARDAGPHGPGSPPWDVISGVLTGVGVVSGSLTGLGWWAFKRSKGDPWVRQI
ncbi:hypothetical protein BEWA_026290 [Theileria equi strain WA]|uniref:Uncharacterized protein n=1 Tax=Theileria equi strain WA TaxID=1537102 RepID=L0AW55_THEEQ|nr:hypothetical protein BEWA_026290 [Theileria equi strain WA]AFZ79780.1 hypothetical protein BEWA_026290 [Theileria equi strain WA]|eukprot:XP_004829446.1 hypothetical protein BEWA_026290 [Theileria equi strain WA]